MTIHIADYATRDVYWFTCCESVRKAYEPSSAEVNTVTFESWL